MRNLIFKYGIYSAVLSICLGLINWFTIAKYFNPPVSQTVGWISIFISLLFIPLGIKYYRDHSEEEKLSYAKAFSIGFGITLVASILNGIYSFFFYLLQGDEFQQWNKKGLSPEELQVYESRMANGPEFIFDPWFQGIVFFFMIFFSGMIVNLISAWLLRNSK